MMYIVIRPCMLGFDVTVQVGNGFRRPMGIYSASELISMLWHTEEPFTVDVC